MDVLSLTRRFLVSLLIFLDPEVTLFHLEDMAEHTPDADPISNPVQLLL